MCGEQPDARLCRRDHYGSPPRVRGTEIAIEREVAKARITPACAGNSRPRSRVTTPRQDHPRVCGEQAKHTRNTALLEGSPPRVRGTATGYQFLAIFERITPACAGNRPLRRKPSKFGRDHPRVCGEQLVIAALGAMVVGSPPRVRGTGTPFWRGGLTWGITPACAGNSCFGYRYGRG